MQGISSTCVRWFSAGVHDVNISMACSKTRYPMQLHCLNILIVYVCVRAFMHVCVCVRVCVLS